MDRQRYARVKEIFREAMRWAPDERAAVVAALAEDNEVRDEVLSLLAHHDEAPLIREPARSGGSVEGTAPAEAPDVGQATEVTVAARKRDDGQAASAPPSQDVPAPHAPHGAAGDAIEGQSLAVEEKPLTVEEKPLAVEGRTLAELLRTERTGGANAANAGWPLERVIRILDPIAEALAIAADRGAVHGAVRADHVILAEVDGETVARLAGSSTAPHTAGPRSARTTSPIEGIAAASAAPEQVLPALGPVGPWTDVYALALLCVELMLGRPAAEGSATAALARTREETTQPTPRAVGLEVPAGVEAVMTMAMTMRPMERYQDARRFWTALRDSVAASQPAAPAPRLPTAPTSSRGPATLARRVWVLGAALIIIAAAIALQRCG